MVLLMQAACKHDNRWVPRHISGRQDEEDGHATAASERDRQILIDYPADLAWNNLACSVSALPFADSHCCLLSRAAFCIRDAAATLKESARGAQKA
jgi:hypothetical protein